jgi:hypothetical protein
MNPLGSPSRPLGKAAFGVQQPHRLGVSSRALLVGASALEWGAGSTSDHANNSATSMDHPCSSRDLGHRPGTSSGTSRLRSRRSPCQHVNILSPTFSSRRRHKGLPVVRLVFPAVSGAPAPRGPPPSWAGEIPRMRMSYTSRPRPAAARSSTATRRLESQQATQVPTRSCLAGRWPVCPALAPAPHAGNYSQQGGAVVGHISRGTR